MFRQENSDDFRSVQASTGTQHQTDAGPQKDTSERHRQNHFIRGGRRILEDPRHHGEQGDGIAGFQYESVAHLLPSKKQKRHVEHKGEHTERHRDESIRHHAETDDAAVKDSAGNQKFLHGKCRQDGSQRQHDRCLYHPQSVSLFHFLLLPKKTADGDCPLLFRSFIDLSLLRFCTWSHP